MYVLLFLLFFFLGLLVSHLTMFWTNRSLKINDKLSKILFLIYGLVSGLSALYAYYTYGYSYEFVAISLLSLTCISVFVSDFKYMLIFDLPLIMSIVLLIISKTYFYGWEVLLSALLNGVITLAILFAIRLLSKLIFKEYALGPADVKLAFIIGFLVPLPYFFIVLILAAFLALPYTYAATKLVDAKEVAFGPFLMGSLFLVFFFLDKFQNILNLF